MSRRALTIVVAALLLVGTAASTTRPSLTVTPSVMHRGAYVLLSGSAASCPVGEGVVVISQALPRAHEFAGVPAVWAGVHAGGRFSVRARIPVAKPPGRYTVSARCGGGNLGVLARLTVLR
jgi:hypothetical protein